MVYLFPGLGTNEKLFEGLQLNAPSKCINYLVPERDETLQHYSQRLAEGISERDMPVLIGVSLGGILAQEISRFIPVKKVILISSIQSEKEKAWFFPLLKILPVYKILPFPVLKKTITLISDLFTYKSREERSLFLRLLAMTDARVIRWGIQQVVNWKQEMPPPDLVQIHGTSDKIFPIRKIRAHYEIRDGQHFMIVQRRDEIAQLLNHLIEEA